MSDPLVDVELQLVPDRPKARAAGELLGSAPSAAGLESTPVRVSVIESQVAAQARGFLAATTTQHRRRHEPHRR